MPNKTDRILNYLPSTFQTFPRPPVLFALVDAFGGELTKAENSLAALMSSHWVDLADKNAQELHDLGRVPTLEPLEAPNVELLALAKGTFDGIAGLYGLTPREDESVEAFRDHLKRYVRTFTDGTVTVQGVLRVAAEALGLLIADSYNDLDTWWKRSAPELTTSETGGADAAVSLLGRPVFLAHGTSSLAAQVSGNVNPAAGTGTALLIKIDALPPTAINLTPGATDPAQIVSQINSRVGQPVATAIGQALTLASPTIGPASRLEILDTANDAAPWSLGLAPRAYQGAGPQRAQIAGNVDLSAGVSLGDSRYLRLVIDGKAGEIDLTGGNLAPLTLDQIKTAINLIFSGATTHDGRFLTIASPSTGSTSKISFGEPGGQNARVALFGDVPSAAGGLDPAPALVTGMVDLSAGVDLSAAGDIRVGMDGSPAVSIHCAGANPSSTQLADIVQAINLALKATIAAHNGHNITLTSTKAGPSSAIVFESIPGGDAVQAIFGIAPRTFSGTAPMRARIAGTVDLSAGVDIRTQPLLSVAVDQSQAVVIDLSAATGNQALVKPADLVSAINTGLGKNVASTDGSHLFLTSPTSGAFSRISVQPPLTTKTRQFVSRAAITGEAAQAIFGATSMSAQGSEAKSATLAGTADLSHGIDLRVNRYLRLIVDSRNPVEIDCAGDRPRATLPAEIVQKINQTSPGNPAGTDGKHLILTSPSSGALACIAIEPSRSADALDSLLGTDPGTYRGSAATGVVFVGMVDLSAGLDLDPKAAVNITIDAGPATEVSLAGDAPNHRTIGDIVSAISISLQAPVARTDGLHILISSPTTGVASKVAFNQPAGTDVTAQLFGIAAPRAYHGSDDTPARVVGKHDLSGGANLQVANGLRLGLDDLPSTDIDCSQESSDLAHAALDEIVKSLNLVLKGAASHDGKNLIITSRKAGPASFVKVEPLVAKDASQALLGDSPLTASGQDATPAVITGPPIAAPLDLSIRNRLRLSVDGGPRVDIAVSAVSPAKTTTAEIVTAINDAFPGLASLTTDSAVQLTSPTAGDSSSVSVATLRHLELIEYPRVPTSLNASVSVSTGTGWTVVNRGAADIFAEVTVTSLIGVSKPAVVNRTKGWIVRFNGIVGRGESLRLRRDVRYGIRAETISIDGQCRGVPQAHIITGPLGTEKHVPFTGSQDLTTGPDGIARLGLNNPLSSRVIVLSARDDVDPDSITIAVTESVFVDSPVLPPGGSQNVRLIGRLESDATSGPQLLGPLGGAVARLRSQHALDAYKGHTVIVYGTLYPDSIPVLVIDEIGISFRVTVSSNANGATVEESYPFAAIGEGLESDSLVTSINAGMKFGEASKLLKAAGYDKATVLSLPRGRSQFLYTDCEDSRFDQAIFNHSNFAGGACQDQGVFDVSHFDRALFAPSGPQTSKASIDVSWSTYQTGAFTLNLPDDLPENFGGRFNQARFGQPVTTPEEYSGTVTEPVTDQSFLVAIINSGRTSDQTPPSDLVTAAVVNALPPGHTSVALPFRKPQFLSGGDDKNPAKMCLAEEGLTGFIELTARDQGSWGNQISVSGRLSGPAIYDVSIVFAGARFESARQVVQGPDLPAAITALLQPAPIGALQAKAAGVRLEITRDGAQSTTQRPQNYETKGKTK
jgi:hypothetical protein